MRIHAEGGGTVRGFEVLLRWPKSVDELASAEGNDAANRIVRRNAYGDSIPGDHFDAEAAHPAAQLSQHFVARIDLHAIKTATMDGHDGALNINEVILAQICCPFNRTSMT